MSTAHTDRDSQDDRAFVASMVQALPEGTTLDDIQYHVEVAKLVRDRSAKLDEALALGVDEAARRGLLISQEQLERNIASWLKK